MDSAKLGKVRSETADDRLFLEGVAFGRYGRSAQSALSSMGKQIDAMGLSEIADAVIAFVESEEPTSWRAAS